MKNIKELLLFSLIIMALSLCSCYYDPPEGYTRDHHTYDEMLEYARSIDPNATVDSEYIDIEDDGHGRTVREWDAVINGTECHVFSISRLVGNKGFAAGEFYKDYYIIDSDYDYAILEGIVAEKQPTWSLEDNRRTEIIAVYTAYYVDRELTREEFDLAYDQAYEIHTEYAEKCISKEAFFFAKAPFVLTRMETVYDEEGNIVDHEWIDFIRIYVHGILGDNVDKEQAYNDYAEAWDLLDSGLPIEE